MRTVWSSSSMTICTAPDITITATSTGWLCSLPSHPGDNSTSLMVRDSAPSS